MNFQELNDLPGWIKTLLTALVGAGGAKLMAVWLENRRLEKGEYRNTLLARIRELEVTIKSMNQTVLDLSVKLALVQEENNDLRRTLGLSTHSNVQPGVQKSPGSDDAKPA